MAERSLFFNATETSPGVFDREYQAQDFTDYLKGVATTGILRDPDNVDGLQVSVVNNSVDINIAEGLAYVEGHYYEIYNEPLKLTLSTPEPQYDRIDRIVIRLDLRLSERYVRAFVKEGTSSASPVAPTLERSELVYELSLAQIRVRKNTSSLQGGDVTDERGDPVLCPWVSSKIIPNYNDDTLQAVLDEVQANDVKIDKHIKNNVGHIYYGTTTGSADVRNINLDPAISIYVDGLAVSFKSHVVNTGAVTINVNDEGAKPLIRANGKPLGANDLRENGIYTIRYNSSTGNFILQGEGGLSDLEDRLVTVPFYPPDGDAMFKADYDSDYIAIGYRTGLAYYIEVFDIQTSSRVWRSSNLSGSNAVSIFSVDDGYLFYGDRRLTKLNLTTLQVDADKIVSYITKYANDKVNKRIYYFESGQLKSTNYNFTSDTQLNLSDVSFLEFNDGHLFTMSEDMKVLRKHNPTTLEVLATYTIGGRGLRDSIAKIGNDLFVIESSGASDYSKSIIKINLNTMTEVSRTDMKYVWSIGNSQSNLLVSTLRTIQAYDININPVGKTLMKASSRVKLVSSNQYGVSGYFDDDGGENIGGGLLYDLN